MGIDNPVKNLTFKQIQSHHCNFDSLFFKLNKMIIVVLNLWLYQEIFNILECFNGNTCLMFVTWH